MNKRIRKCEVCRKNESVIYHRKMCMKCYFKGVALYKKIGSFDVVDSTYKMHYIHNKGSVYIKYSKLLS